MQKGKGFTPIAYFGGTFYGNDKKIDNIYINATTMNKGFFSEINSSTIICDLTIDGIIRSDMYYTGGISGRINPEQNLKLTRGKIENCHNKCEITGKGYVGGIVGYVPSTSNLENIINCSNEGTLSSIENLYVGGIVGNTDCANMVIENCYNSGIVVGSGITGNNLSHIKNCYNKGKTEYGLVYSNQSKISNCYNVGTCSTGYVIGNSYYTNSNLYRCTYLEGTANGLVQKSKEDLTDDNSGKLTIEDMKQYTFVELLNQNQEEKVSVWKQDINNINEGYPILYWQIN